MDWPSCKIESRAMNPKRRASRNVGVGARDQTVGPLRVRGPARINAKLNEIFRMPVPAIPESGEMAGRGKMVALGTVATISEHKILDSIVRPSGPGQKVVDLSPCG
jgi:hypothetical protein